MASYASSMTGWVALAAGGVGAMALLFIILFYTVGGVFGPLNDLCNGLLGILSGLLAALLYLQVRADAPLLSLVGLVLALVGGVVVPVGSALVVLGRAGWYRAGFYTMVGFAGIGLWLVGQNLLTPPGQGWWAWQPFLASSAISIAGRPRPGTSSTWACRPAAWAGWSCILSGACGWA
jgi:hypothetical protein